MWLVGLGLLASPTLAHPAAQPDLAPTAEANMAIWKDPSVALWVDSSFARIPAAMNALNQALDAWATSVPNLPEVILAEAPSDQLSDPVIAKNTIRYAADGDLSAQGALATTQVSFDTELSQIYEVDIVVNGLYQFGNAGALRGLRRHSDEPIVYDLQNVLTHELGHFFGLEDRFDDTTATMYGYIEPGETSKRHIADCDRMDVEALYPAEPMSESGCGASIAPLPKRQSALGLLWVLGMLSMLRCRKRDRSAP